MASAPFSSGEALGELALALVTSRCVGDDWSLSCLPSFGSVADEAEGFRRLSVVALVLLAESLGGVGPASAEAQAEALARVGLRFALVAGARSDG